MLQQGTHIHQPIAYRRDSFKLYWYAALNEHELDPSHLTLRQHKHRLLACRLLTRANRGSVRQLQDVTRGTASKAKRLLLKPYSNQTVCSEPEYRNPVPGSGSASGFRFCYFRRPYSGRLQDDYFSTEALRIRSPDGGKRDSDFGAISRHWIPGCRLSVNGLV